MSTLTVGQSAPGFRLASAQGAEIALEDYRGRNHLIVWFTKGMACPFCRQHMSQLARAYPEIRKRNAEVLEVTPTTPERARVYASKFRLPFPYLCDAGDQVRRAWGVDVRRRGPAWYVGGLIKGVTTRPPENDFGKAPPAPGELPLVLRDDDMGFFVVDRGGVVRYAYTGSYVSREAGGTRPIPANDAILRELEHCG